MEGCVVTYIADHMGASQYNAITRVDGNTRTPVDSTAHQHHAIIHSGWKNKRYLGS
jgi:hypothetical protein